ncbi:DUF938 domain-containing protein [Candidatus Uabimicrobium amorphum]|uniref:Methylase n=1 Tax=Uabimicrobium amorphum TaxID=2596890 RepID=A0A5S9F1L6_UABAM|nr:DUF938 domain-containing protein [Candidatus Uabimicrobium amorphum]BBM82321.1 methylase [Candidatus Uabimicrobium amorphum]
MYKPFSQACERNKLPILQHLKDIFCKQGRVLEIGSGTGQHAVYFAKQLPHLIWQTSDVEEHHRGIETWLEEVHLKNLRLPLTLDVSEKEHWPQDQFNYVFTANTCHIMSWPQVKDMLVLVGQVLEPHGYFCVYGPFKYNGNYTSESNHHFDLSLRHSKATMGIRDFEDICAFAEKQQLKITDDHTMPANNQLLSFQKV